MKEFIELIKALWRNKRTRAMAILLMYFIFFMFVFSIISPTDNTNLNNKEETKEEVKDEFDYLNNIEITNYNVYDISNNIVLEYDTNLINGNVIYKLVKNSTLASTNYIENSNMYQISIKDYESLINNLIVDIEGNIIITISDNNIILDFTMYYGYKINIDIRS